MSGDFVVNLNLSSAAICLLQFPVENIEFDSIEAESSAASCLEEKWKMAAACVNKQTLFELPFKANTFMASLGRLDDGRMLKVKELDGNEHVAGTYSTLERERMLGFPEGYVGNAGKIFVELCFV